MSTYCTMNCLYKRNCGAQRCIKTYLKESDQTAESGGIVRSLHDRLGIIIIII